MVDLKEMPDLDVERMKAARIDRDTGAPARAEIAERAASAK